MFNLLLSDSQTLLLSSAISLRSQDLQFQYFNPIKSARWFILILAYRHNTMIRSSIFAAKAQNSSSLFSASSVRFIVAIHYAGHAPSTFPVSYAAPCGLLNIFSPAGSMLMQYSGRADASINATVENRACQVLLIL